MIRKNGRKHGEVFTKLDVVNYILDESLFLSHIDLSNHRILEPASGKGAFAVEIIKRLAKSSEVYGFDFITSLNNNVRLVEIDVLSYKVLKEKIRDVVFELGFEANLIDDSILICDDYLKCNFDLEFGSIVGNPPYIRHEVIDIESKEYYKRNFSTFKYRADLYIPFYEKSLDNLEANGTLSFICSNRWLNNQYGKPLRNKISKEFNLTKIINIERSSPFDETVIAYPCITTIKNCNSTGTTLYFQSLEKEVHLEKLFFKKCNSPITSEWQNLFLDYNINHIQLEGIVDQGFNIGIGVATGADKIFIKTKKELDGIEKDRVLPIIKSSSLKGDQINWDDSFVINPFKGNDLCNLNQYPRLKEYFETNEVALKKRHTAIKTPDKWFKTIDKIKPDLLKKAKLLLPDLSGSKYLFIDEGKFYPHHNIYYITHPNIGTLKIIASILMTDFIKNQLSQIGIRMNGGLPRFQSQSLKKLRVPIISEFSKKDKEKLIDAYDNKKTDVFNEVINKYCTQHCI